MRPHLFVCLFVCSFLYLPPYFFQSAVINDEKAAEFRHKVYRAITLTHVAEYLLIALGALCIVVAVVLVIIPASRKQHVEMTIQARMRFIYLCSAVTVFEHMGAVIQRAEKSFQ